MKPPPFSYTKAESMAQALTVLAERGDDCKILAGGQSLVPMMNLRLTYPQHLLDINGLTMLDYVTAEDGQLKVGGLTRHSTLKNSALVAEHCPLMTEAYGYVAHKPVRNRGTIGGNLSHADPSSEMSAVALAAGAVMVARSTGGERQIEAADFFLGTLETALAPDELLVEIRYPAWPGGRGWSFLEVSPRKGDFAIVGVAACLGLKDGACETVRLAYCGVGDRARRIGEAEQAVEGGKPDQALFAKAGEIAGRAIDPQGDYHADPEYRRDLATTLTRRALIAAHSRIA
ncbi:MAG: xanthine dehydrogenase family protein subunit M [Alphaproteobacteria bacterium]|jgi:CO/xanthine dehydrogenase FAD-binding subunit|nr:xanthine dehydrogenase family protein subunit M [Alphaproteobacteria bacterium]